MLRRNTYLTTIFFFSLFLYLNTDAQGSNNENGGIGVVLLMQQRQNLSLEYVLPDCPADKAGLQNGDVILQINGQPTKGMTLQEATKRIAGPVGSKVQLLVRPSGGRRRTVEVTRAKIEYGAKSESVFFGRFQALNEDDTFVTIKKVQNGYAEIICEKEHWRGIGKVYRNPNYNTFHYKGVFYKEDNPDVEKKYRGVAGYFFIDCILENSLNMSCQWSLNNNPDNITKTILVKVDSEQTDSQ